MDIQNKILGRKEVKIGKHATGIELTMPHGVLLVMNFDGKGRPCAFLPTKGKARVDGVQHHVKYGTQRGYGAMWLNEKTGKPRKKYTIECAAALVSYAAFGAWGGLFEAARLEGTFDELKAGHDATYAAVCTAKADDAAQAGLAL